MRARLRPDPVVRLGPAPGSSGRLGTMAITGPTPSLLPLAEIDISAPEFWLADRDYREAAFRTLREQAPVTFFAEHPFPNFPLGPGYWALTRHEDVWHASRNPQLFCSSKGTNIPDLPMEINE